MYKRMLFLKLAVVLSEPSAANGLPMAPSIRTLATATAKIKNTDPPARSPPRMSELGPTAERKDDPPPDEDVDGSEERS